MRMGAGMGTGAVMGMVVVMGMGAGTGAAMGMVVAMAIGVEVAMGMAMAIGVGRTIEEAPGSGRDGALDGALDGARGGGALPPTGGFHIRIMQCRPPSSSNPLRCMSSRHRNPKNRTLGITARIPEVTTRTSNNVRAAG
jgi:hypothetical protein